MLTTLIIARQAQASASAAASALAALNDTINFALNDTATAEAQREAAGLDKNTKMGVTMLCVAIASGAVIAWAMKTWHKRRLWVAARDQLRALEDAVSTLASDGSVNGSNATLGSGGSEGSSESTDSFASFQSVGRIIGSRCEQWALDVLPGTRPASQVLDPIDEEAHTEEV